MKLKLYALVLALFIGSLSVQAQLRTPALSPGSTVKQTVGLTDIEITYSRPAVKGRTIFGKDGIVPYGKFWRTGANAATKISFTSDLSFGEANLPKGDYTILTKPSSTSWEVFIYKYDSTNWSSYVEKDPIAILDISIQQLNAPIESLEYAIQNVTMDGADLEISWNRTSIQIPIQIDTKAQVLKNIDHAMAGPSIFENFNAALYLHENKIELPKALTYIQNATKSKNAQFFMVYREALILKDLGRKNEALTAAKRSLELSEKAKNDDFIRFSKKLIAEL
ncbi:DUF2911 domain-containing protein [Spongiivirga citrea]|uniref:DUF2911 domain-containing protein n=1 Tax=Spongiivirga citrea TaxID=1481457 RepID=A0A6M0CR76_9FLAO|nr:DUF2911 domain-containing protein [Spongiivirga citrea]NER18369.1 DUF2911 domain-containing protein [Spongiivirga citrea]